MPYDEGIKPEIRKHFSPFEDPPKSGKIRGCADHDGVCFTILHEFGEVWRNPYKCNRKTCMQDGTVIEEVCPEPEVPEGCVRIPGDLPSYQDFPFCCDRVACPGEDEYWEDDEWLPEECNDKYCVRDIGEVWSEHKYGICNRKRCERNKYNMAEIFEETCPEVEVPKGCKLEDYPDLTKEFPDCCEKVVCPPGHPAYKGDPDSKNATEKKITTNPPVSATDDSGNNKQTGITDEEKSSKEDSGTVTNRTSESEQEKPEGNSITRLMDLLVSLFEESSSSTRGNNVNNEVHSDKDTGLVKTKGKKEKRRRPKIPDRTKSNQSYTKESKDRRKSKKEKENKNALTNDGQKGKSRKEKKVKRKQ